MCVIVSRKGKVPDLFAAGPREVLVQLRAHGEIHPASAEMDGGLLRIRLGGPARGVASGQAAVLYEGDAVLGSGTIAATRLSSDHDRGYPLI